MQRALTVVALIGLISTNVVKFYIFFQRLSDNSGKDAVITVEMLFIYLYNSYWCVCGLSAYFICLVEVVHACCCVGCKLCHTAGVGCKVWQDAHHTRS